MSSDRGRGAAPRCPFCGIDLNRPADFQLSDAERAFGGRCSCGAIYLVDQTGKNVGSMMAMALAAVADELAKSVGELDPDKDYEDAVLSYDWRTHRSTGISIGYMDGYGRLYMIKARKQK